jgi:DNA polymerase III subunit gamma/tau
MQQYQPFHLKYRPQTLSEVVGQKHVTQTLTNAIQTKKIAAAYLFTGGKGTGKTSTARILAKSLNCQSSKSPTVNPCGKCNLCKSVASSNAIDVTELDAASNSGVDNMRDLIAGLQFKQERRELQNFNY